MAAFLTRMGEFSRVTQGSVTVIFGVSLMSLLLIGGLALDTSRAYSVQSQVQAALDAAALAGAKALQEDGTTDAQVQSISKAMFDTFLPSFKLKGLNITNFTATPNRTADSVTTVADSNLQSIFGNLAGSNPLLKFPTKSTVVYRADKVELALVVDVTGSMNQIPPSDTKTKIQSLKEAAGEVIDALMADSPSDTAVRIAVAPFSASVNAGALANATSASPSVTTCGLTWFWGYKCTTSAGADVDTCVIERAASYEDSSPTGDKIPAVPSAPYGNYVCPNAVVVPLQGKSQAETLKTTINSYTASGATAGHIGAAWGWYLLSEKWASVLPAASKPEPRTNTNVHKHVIFMTDGQFNTSYLNGPNNSASQQEQESYAEFQSLCDKMKDPSKGNITLWTIGFDLGGLGTTVPRDQLIACSGADHFFDAATGPDLKAAFKAIVANMRGMHVSQ